MKYAWIENTVIRDLTAGDPLDVFHPDIATLFDTQVPDEAESGDTFTADSLDYMTAIKILAPGRKAEILTGDPR